MDGETKRFDICIDLPDGYEVQLMVLQDFPGGRKRRGLKMNVYRSRIWIGHQAEPEPLLHRSQEHGDLQMAVDACYSMLLLCCGEVVDSADALEAARRQADQYFGGAAQALGGR